MRTVDAETFRMVFMVAYESDGGITFVSRFRQRLVDMPAESRAVAEKVLDWWGAMECDLSPEDEWDLDDRWTAFCGGEAPSLDSETRKREDG